VLSANKWIFASSAAHDSSTTCVPGRKHRRTHKQNPEPKLRFCKQITSSEINNSFNSEQDYKKSGSTTTHEAKEPLMHHIYTRTRPNKFYCHGRHTKKEVKKVFSILTTYFNLSRMHLHDKTCCSVSHRVLFCPCLHQILNVYYSHFKKSKLTPLSQSHKINLLQTHKNALKYSTNISFYLYYSC